MNEKWLYRPEKFLGLSRNEPQFTWKGGTPGRQGTATIRGKEILVFTCGPKTRGEVQNAITQLHVTLYALRHFNNS